MKLRQLILMITMLFVVGCSNEQPASSQDEQEENNDLSINVGIGAIGRAVAVEGEKFSHESAINILLFDETEGGIDYNGISQSYTYKNPSGVEGVWIPTKTALQLKISKASVLAHYPAVLPSGSSLSPDKKTLNVELSEDFAFGTPDTYNGENSFWLAFKEGDPEEEIRLADGETDYLTGKGSNSVDRDNKSTSIAMKHALGMVVVRTYRAVENTNPGILKSFTIKNTEAGTKPLCKGAFDIASTKFTPNSTPMTYHRTMNDFVDGCYFALMVYPASFADGDVTLTVEVDEATYTMPIKTMLNWEPGKIVLYNVKLNGTSAVLEEVISVLPWPDLNEDDNSHEFPLD